ncbi:MAG: tRNA (adenosine(37)-N6)-threonylcarbamoyltransferase complex dimerization subunit type 1 TsaB [Hyphomicrobiales bacterium]
MTTVLAIDTASPTFALAVAAGGQVARSMQHDGEQDHSQQLLAAIDRLLGDSRRELGGIVVVRGPGSYAGLRVGIATAEGLALATGAPLAGVGTMEAIAAASGGDGVAIHPAGRGEFAAQRFAGGVPEGELFAAQPGDLQGERLAGEGAADLGGAEVTPEGRVRSALVLGLPRLESAAAHPATAIYLREPNITRPRHRPAAAG